MLQIKNRGFSFFLDEKVRHDYMFRKRQLKRKINIKFLFKKKQTGKDTVCRRNTECFIKMMKCYSMV